MNGRKVLIDNFQVLYWHNFIIILSIKFLVLLVQFKFLNYEDRKDECSVHTISLTTRD